MTPRAGDLVACETVADSLTHVRRIVTRAYDLSGHAYPWPSALCGGRAIRDLPGGTDDADCSACRAALARVPR